MEKFLFACKERHTQKNNQNSYATMVGLSVLFLFKIYFL